MTPTGFLDDNKYAKELDVNEPYNDLETLDYDHVDELIGLKLDGYKE